MTTLEADAIIFCFGAFASTGAAYSVLADELKPHFVQLNKQDREALARIMIKTSNGKLSCGANDIEWIHAESDIPGSNGDLYYKITN